MEDMETVVTIEIQQSQTCAVRCKVMLADFLACDLSMEDVGIFRAEVFEAFQRLLASERVPTCADLDASAELRRLIDDCGPENPAN